MPITCMSIFRSGAHAPPASANSGFWWEIGRAEAQKEALLVIARSEIADQPGAAAARDHDGQRSLLIETRGDEILQLPERRQRRQGFSGSIIVGISPRGRLTDIDIPMPR